MISYMGRFNETACLLSRILPLLTVVLPCAASAGPPKTSHTASFKLDAAHETVDPFDLNDTSGYVWQGFQHQWKRRAFGLFKTPHRISQLSSRILDETHTFDGKSGKIEHQARSDMFQSTGVDGDWMRPVLHYGVFHSNALEVRRGTLHVEFTDDLGEDSNAKTVVHGEFQFKSRGWLVLNTPKTEAILHGFSLKTLCIEQDPTEPTSNSNGIWPYLFKVGINGCARSRTEPHSDEFNFTCGYTIEVGRAWTPHKGGGKPLNPGTQYQFDIGVQILSAADENLKATRFGYTLLDLKPRSKRGLNGKVPLATNGTGGGLYPSAMVGIREFGFLLESRRPADAWTMGRYLSGVGISVTADSYDPGTGAFDLTIENGVDIPGTVKNANLEVHSELTLL